jgi:hypothetical protein
LLNFSKISIQIFKKKHTHTALLKEKKRASNTPLHQKNPNPQNSSLTPAPKEKNGPFECMLH